MSGSAEEAVKILIAADDAASKKFRDVEDAADKFKERLQEINGVLTAGGLTKIAGPLTSIASKLGVVGIAGKALHSTLSLVGEGADEAIRRKFAEPLADASTAIENLKGGLRDVGKAIAEAFADSNFGQISRRLLGYAAAPLLTGAIASDATRAAMQKRAEGFGTHNQGSLQQKLLQNQADLQKAREREQKALAMRRTGLNGRPVDSPALDTARSDILTLLAEQARLQKLLRNPRTLKTIPGLNALGKTPAQAGDAMAKMFGAGKLNGESPFTTAIGKPKDLFSGFREEAEKQAAKLLADKRQRQVIIDRNRTAAEIRDQDLATAKRLLGGNPEQLKREQAAIQDRFAKATAAPAGTPAKPGELGGNAAQTNRFGGGQVGGVPQEVKELKQVNARLLWFQQQAQKEKKALEVNENARRGNPTNNVGAGFF